MVWACILDSDIQDVVKIDRHVDTKKYHQSWAAMQYHLHQINSLIFSMTAIPTMPLLQEKHSWIKKHTGHLYPDREANIRQSTFKEELWNIL